ncbi:MAG: HAD family phosphatase [Eubacterium sp.]|nr:HAD family phosphatase [Eubacterium sp.]
MKTIVFDMDGVIFDSERVIFEEWKELSKKYGFENIEIPYYKCIGVNAATTRKIMLDFYGEDFPYDEYCREQSQKYHEEFDGGRLPLKKGVEELLKYLKEAGFFVAIASSTRSALVEQQIVDAGLRPYFDRIVGGDMVERSKPEPDIFLKAIEGLTVKPQDVMVIEDSFNGIRAAFHAGMIPVMVPDMIEPDAEMREKAALILNDLLEVKRYLECR